MLRLFIVVSNYTKREQSVFLIFVDVFFIGFVQFLNGTTSLLKVGFREREKERERKGVGEQCKANRELRKIEREMMLKSH